MTWGLTPEEDAELRRLYILARYAEAGSEVLERYLELRLRDRRVEVREPVDEVEVNPVAYPEESGNETSSV